MVSKRFSSAKTRKPFGIALEKMLAKLPTYDLVLASGENALHFVTENKETLLPTAPVVFFGGNDIEFVTISLPMLPGCRGHLNAGDD